MDGSTLTRGQPAWAIGRPDSWLRPTDVKARKPVTARDTLPGVRRPISAPLWCQARGELAISEKAEGVAWLSLVASSAAILLIWILRSVLG